MAAGIKATVRNLVVVSVGLAVGLAAPCALAQVAPAAVPVPFSVDVAGTGAVGTPTCTTGIPTTSGVSYGDGCPGPTAGLAAPQGAAVDQYGNVYVADYTDHLVRVVYNGGAAVAALITAANSGYIISATRNAPAPAPVVGNIYTIAGLGTTPAALTATQTDGKFACANYAATGQAEALNSLGDGCPAASAIIGPRDVSLDANGNLFLTDYTDGRVRVLCVNCAATTLAAQLITLENPSVTPVNGAMYTIAGYANGYRDAAIGFGGATAATVLVALLRSPTAAVVSSADDVYIADNLNNAVRLLYNGGAVAKNILTAEGITPTLGYVYTIAGAGCVSAASGKTGSVVTANSCLTTTGSDTATLGNALGANVVWTVYLDPNNNVYYTDSGNARIKVIYGGVAPPLTLPDSAYPTLKTGYSYSFAGQGASIASGVAPSQILLGSPQGVGGDANGNIFFMDYTNALIYEAYAQTGIAALIGGGGAIATPVAGAYCNGGSSGPTMSDAFYNGCPLTQVKLSGTRGPLVADAAGNLYFGDSPGSLLRKFTYNPSFPATAVGSTSAAQAYAFTFTSASTLAAAPLALLQKGTADGEFSDAGGDTCTAALAAAAGAPGTTCVVNVAFKPAVPGVRSGAVELMSAAVAGYSDVNGVGVGAGLLVDPGTSTTTGTSLAPNGIAVDGAGRAYVSDLTSKSVLVSNSGVLTPVITGLTAPAGVAVDGAGDVFVADSSANTITEYSSVQAAKFTFASGLGNPHGLATDAAGNLYVADTSNNRVVMYGPGATQYTVAGFSGLAAPQAVAVDASGNVYAADSTHVVKLSAGAQTTIASGSSTGVAVDAAGNVLVTSGTMLTEYPSGGGSAIVLSSALVTPKAVALDAAGDAYIADNGIAGYVELQRTAGFYQFTSSNTGTTVDLTSSGNATLTGATFSQSDSNDFTLVPATTNGCSGALPVGTTCALTASFKPTLPGTLTDNITFNSNAANASPITLKLTGNTPSQTTGTSFTVGSATLVYGNVETLTATVSATLSAPTSGTVNFYNNGTTLLGTANVGTGGVATLTFVPGVGAYSSVTAVFVPSGLSYLGSTSSAKTFSVTAASLMVTAANASKLYGQANPALTYSITGFVNNDTQATATTGAPAESTTATTTSSVGSYPITITQGTLAAANYTFTFVNGSLAITGATAQTITFGTLVNVTYGVAPITLAATASSGLAVSYSATGPAVVSGSTLTITGAGTVSVTATQTGNNTYAAATPVVQSFGVGKAALTVTATNASQVYGGTTPSLAYTVSGFVNGDVQATATTGAPTESTTATTASNVGSYAITLGLGTLASSNYSIALVNGSLTVTAATLTLTANSTSKVYGAGNPTFTGSLSGTVNNDVLTETFSTTATTSSAPGTYAIVPGATGTNVGNYTFAATNGTLTITQAKPTVTLASSATSGYNGTTSIVLTATLASPTSGAPTGTVTFSVAGVTVGTATISGTTAVLTTTQLPIGADSVTASYAGDTNFMSATSSAVLVTIAAGFGTTATSTQLTFQPGYQEAQTYLTINPGGRTDTLTFACQGLPSKLSCAFSPGTLALTGLTGPQTVEMLVSNSAATASVDKAAGMESKIMLAALPGMLLLLVGVRRRRAPRLLAMALVAMLSTMAFSGCGTSPNSLEQGAGTYAFTATVNSGTTTLQTINFTVVVP